jgi:hypothetical protein
MVLKQKKLQGTEQPNMKGVKKYECGINSAIKGPFSQTRGLTKVRMLDSNGYTPPQRDRSAKHERPEKSKIVG